MTPNPSPPWDAVEKQPRPYTRVAPVVTEHESDHEPSRYTYVHARCRCEACRAANRRYMLNRRVRLNGTEPPSHGLNAYDYYGCRCDECRTAKAASNAAYRTHGTPVAGAGGAS